MEAYAAAHVSRPPDFFSSTRNASAVAGTERLPHLVAERLDGDMTRFLGCSSPDFEHLALFHMLMLDGICICVRLNHKGPS
jgi:hypothetical protein